MRRLALVVVAALASIPASAEAWGWGGTHGDGQKVTQPRQVPAFTSVRLEGSIDAAMKVGGARAVAVTIDQNLQSQVTTEVSGTTLVIGTKDASWQGKALVEITVPELRGVTIEGSSDVTVEGGQGDLALEIVGSGDLRWNGAAAKLVASISGSGDLHLSGTAEQVRISVEGSGDVKAGGLTARTAEVEVDGSGDVEVTLDGGPLRARVSGSGDVIWHGRAMVEQASVSGSGQIVRR
jgi:hypothetical protein